MSIMNTYSDTKVSIRESRGIQADGPDRRVVVVKAPVTDHTVGVQSSAPKISKQLSIGWFVFLFA
jgi:hypothetical protein